MNIHKQIVNVKGIASPKSFPTQEELNALPLVNVRIVDRGEVKTNKEVDYSKLERETIGNIILNVLNNHVQRDKMDGFYCNAIGSIILSAKEGEDIQLSEKCKRFLISALDEATISIEKQGEVENRKGYYSSWAIAQVKTELGENPIIE